MPKVSSGGIGGQQFIYIGIHDSTREYFANDWVSDGGTPNVGFVATVDIPVGVALTDNRWDEFVAQVVTGPAGIRGLRGFLGNGLLMIFTRNNATPNDPTGLTWDGVTQTLGVNLPWTLGLPTGTDLLHGSLVAVDSTADTATLIEQFQVGGADIEIQFSIDGTSNWHDTLTSADYFVRFRIAAQAWSIGRQFVAYGLTQQWSEDNTSWHDTQTANDVFTRFSVDNGVNYSSGVQIGSYPLIQQWSDDDVTYHDTQVPNDVYTRFSSDNRNIWSSGVQVQAFNVRQQWSTNNIDWHTTQASLDDYTRFSVDNGVTYSDGLLVAAQPLTQQWSDDNSTWHDAQTANDVYTRFSIDGGTTYSSGVQIGSYPVRQQWSADNATWHDAQTANDVYTRFSSDNGVIWSDGVQVAGQPLRQQWSDDNISYHDAQGGSDIYTRFSVDGGTTWSNGVLVVGSHGTNAPLPLSQYSTDNSTWHDALAADDLYKRDSNNNGVSWTIGYRIVGTPGTPGQDSPSGGTGRSRGSRIFSTTVALPTAPNTTVFGSVGFMLNGTQPGFNALTGAITLPPLPPQSPDNVVTGMWLVLREDNTELNVTKWNWGLNALIGSNANSKIAHLYDPTPGQTTVGTIDVNMTLSNSGILALTLHGNGRTLRPNLYVDAYYAVNAGGVSGVDIHNVLSADTTGVPSLVTLDISSVSAYTDGMTVSFQMPGVVNDADVALRIGALAAYEMVKNTDLLGFAAGEIEPESWILARYDMAGTQWITNISADYSTVFVHAPVVGHVGNNITLRPRYTLGASSSIAFKFVSEGTNTGDMTIEVEGSGIARASLRKQDRTEYAAGEFPDGLLIAMIYDTDNDFWITANYLPGSGIKDWVSGVSTAVGISVFDTIDGAPFRCVIADNGNNGPPSGDNANFEAWGAGELVETDIEETHNETNRDYDLTFTTSNLVSVSSSIFNIVVEDPAVFDLNQSADRATFNTDTFRAHGLTANLTSKIVQVRNETTETHTFTPEIFIDFNNGASEHVVWQGSQTTMAAGAITFVTLTFNSGLDMTFTGTGTVEVKVRLVGLTSAIESGFRFGFATTATFGFQYDYVISQSETTKVRLLNAELNMVDGANVDFPALSNNAHALGNLLSDIHEQVHAFDFIYARYASRLDVPDTLTVTYTKDTAGTYSFGLPSPWTDNQSDLITGGYHYQAIVIGFGNETARTTVPFEISDHTEIHSPESEREHQENNGALDLIGVPNMANMGGFNVGKRLQGDAAGELCRIRFRDVLNGYDLGDINNETVIIQSQQLDAGSFSYALQRRYSKLIFDIDTAVAGASWLIAGTNFAGDSITQTITTDINTLRYVTSNVFQFDTNMAITITPTGFTNEILTLSVYELATVTILANELGVMEKRDLARAALQQFIDHDGNISGNIDVHIIRIEGQSSAGSVLDDGIVTGSGYLRLGTMTPDLEFTWTYLFPDGTPGMESVGPVDIDIDRFGTSSTEDSIALIEGVLLESTGQIIIGDSNLYPRLLTVTSAGLSSQGIPFEMEDYSVYEYFTAYMVRKRSPSSGYIGMNTSGSVRTFTPSNINMNDIRIRLRDAVIGTFLIRKFVGGDAAVDGFTPVHGNRFDTDTIAGRLFNTKPNISPADVVQIITDEIGGHLANFDQTTVSGSIPAVDSASREHSQVWIVDPERIGTATFAAIYTSNRFLDAWNETVSFDGELIRNFNDNVEYFTDELLREEGKLYLALTDYRGTLSPKDNPTAFLPIESSVLSAPEKSIEDVVISFIAPAGDPGNIADWVVLLEKPGYPNISDNIVEFADGSVMFTEKSELEFPTVASGIFTVTARNYIATDVDLPQGEYQILLRKGGQQYQTYLTSEAVTVPANGSIQVHLIGNPVSINFEANEVLQYDFDTTNTNTNVHVVGNINTSFAGFADFIETESDALEMDSKSDVVMNDRKNDVQYPVVNTQGFLGKYKAEIETNKFPQWTNKYFQTGESVLFDGQSFWAKQNVTPADGDPFQEPDLWQPIYALSRPYDQSNYGPINFEYILWGSSSLMTSYQLQRFPIGSDPHNTITAVLNGQYLHIRCNQKITDLEFRSLLSSATAKNHTTTARDITNIGFVGDVIKSGETTPQVGSKQVIVTTNQTYPIVVPARDPAVANSGETVIEFVFTDTDPSIHFENLEIGDVLRLYFEGTPAFDSDVELLYTGFDGSFNIEGEVDHPNGDRVILETPPSERALRTYFYISDDVLNGYNTLIVGLELNAADPARNSYQDITIDLGSLRRNVLTTQSGGFKHGVGKPGYLGYDYTLSPGDALKLIFRDNGFHLYESIETEAPDQPPTGVLNYIHDLNPIGGFNRYQYYIGGAYLHTDGRIWIIHDHASGLFSMDPNTGRVERRSATSILQWGGGNFQDPSGLSYDDSDGKFMIMFHHQTDNRWRIQKVEPGNSNTSIFGPEQSSPHYGLQKVGNLWYSLRVIGTTTALQSIDSTGDYTTIKNLDTNIGACALTWDLATSRMIAVSRTTDRVYSFDLTSTMDEVVSHGSAFDTQLTIGGIVYTGDATNQRMIAISNNNSTPGKRNKVYEMLYKTGPARRIRTVIARR